jgi:hypothetical protein
MFINIVCDTIYLTFIDGLKYSFPPTIVTSVRRSIIGFFGDLRSNVMNGFRGMIGRLRNINPNVSRNNN